jgi:hypothetical protein
VRREAGRNWKMIHITILAGAALLALGLGLAVCGGCASLRVPILTLEIMAGVVAKLGMLRFREAYQLTWLVWRLFRMDGVQLAHVLVAVETRQAWALARSSAKG